MHFYPRSPCGERHNIPPDSVLIIDISIHALLAESDRCKVQKNNKTAISIHALLAESDRQNYECFEWIKAFLSTLSLRRATIVGGAGNNAINISIHALLAESDTSSVKVSLSGSTFLSTLSLRRATRKSGNNAIRKRHFYPRSPCGERHTHPVGILVAVIFLSTLSLRRAT